MKMKRSNSLRSPQQGFTMIEALIAFAVLGFGIMGIVALLNTSKVQQHQSVQRARAVTLADELIERIRINPAAMATYNIGMNELGGVADRTEPTPNCSTESCTPAQLAAHDLWEWERSLMGADTVSDGVQVGGLVNPRACVVFTPQAGRARTGQVSVIIQYRGLMKTFDAVQGDDPVCGDGDAGTDEFRRQVTVATYVVDETEL